MLNYKYSLPYKKINTFINIVNIRHKLFNYHNGINPVPYNNSKGNYSGSDKFRLPSLEVLQRSCQSVFSILNISYRVHFHVILSCLSLCLPAFVKPHRTGSIPGDQQGLALPPFLAVLEIRSITRHCVRFHCVHLPFKPPGFITSC